MTNVISNTEPLMRMPDLVLDKMYNEWSCHNDVSRITPSSDDEVREALIKDLTFVSKMSVKEYTLYQKWCEIQDQYETEKVSTLFEGVQTQMKNKDDERFIREIKSNIWIPTCIDDYMNLEPRLFYTKDDETSVEWNCIRTFTSTMKNNSNIGRNLNFIVKDDKTKKYLGVICISSDFLDLTPRDNYIGWDRKKKTQGHMINFTAIGSTILPLQPLGYNALGGKLLALLCLSDDLQNTWKEQYGDVLAGITTTSLYGSTKEHGASQYDGLKHWKRMGYTSGSVSYEATKPTIQKLLAWLKVNHTRKWFEWYVATKPSGQPYKRDHRNRSYTFTYSKLNIPKELVRSKHERGIYFCPLYNNTKEFLCGDVQEKDLVKSFDTSYEALVGIWKTKYASKRLKTLTEQNRISTETLFYDDLIFLSWEETKEKYLGQVGR